MPIQAKNSATRSAGFGTGASYCCVSRKVPEDVRRDGEKRGTVQAVESGIAHLWGGVVKIKTEIAIERFATFRRRDTPESDM